MSVERIRDAVSNASTYMTEHPDEARYTDSVAKAVLEDGLRIRVEGADHSIVTDMPTSVGGEDTSPSPGWFLRAALASCDAMMIALRAASQGVELTRLQVKVDSESDDRGILGLDDSIPAGPFSVRRQVRLAAKGATPDQLHEIVRWAIEHCPVDDAVRRAVPVELEVEVD